MKRRPHNYMHGLTGTAEHNVWMKMLSRCNDVKKNRYYAYGARGIAVCERWSNSFPNFIKDMGNRPSPKHSIDRVNNNLGYSPENCRWATTKEQARNKSQSRRLTAYGETKVIVEWAEDPRCAVGRGALYARLDRIGWTSEEIISTPVNGIRHEHGRKPRRKKTV